MLHTCQGAALGSHSQPDTCTHASTFTCAERVLLQSDVQATPVHVNPLQGQAAVVRAAAGQLVATTLPGLRDDWLVLKSKVQELEAEQRTLNTLALEELDEFNTRLQDTTNELTGARTYVCQHAFLCPWGFLQIMTHVHGAL